LLSRYAAKATATREPRVWAARKRKGCEAHLAYDSRVLSVAYFGPAGTFTEEALLSQEDLAAGTRTAYSSVPEVIAAVERHDADGGVVPIENMIEGSVSVTRLATVKQDFARLMLSGDEFTELASPRVTIIARRQI